MHADGEHAAEHGDPEGAARLDDRLVHAGSDTGALGWHRPHLELDAYRRGEADAEADRDRHDDDRHDQTTRDERGHRQESGGEQDEAEADGEPLAPLLGQPR